MAMPKFTPNDLDVVNREIEKLEARREKIIAALINENHKLEERINQLQARSEDIQSFLKPTTKLSPEDLTGDKKNVYHFIKASPGATRSDIDAFFAHLSKTQVNGILTYLRRDQELIENRGGRGPGGSRWYAF